MTNSDVYDFAIIGAGLVGLATAWAIRDRFPDASIVLLEKEVSVGLHQSGRNSGVLHSGIYYKTGSLKATLVARGRSVMLDFCTEHKIHHELCGKLIVAIVESELPQLQTLVERGKENDLVIHELDSNGIKEVEPHAAGIKGIWIPQTGIVDYSAVANVLAQHLAERSVHVETGNPVASFENSGRDLTLITKSGRLVARKAVNCAGLFSDRLARRTGIETGLRIIPFRGEYFRLGDEAKSLVKGLIYPLADPQLPFLGVHLTKMTDGEVLVGPNAVLAFKREGYHAWDFDIRDTLDTLSYAGFWKLVFTNIGAGLGEMLKAWSLSAFTRATQKLVPEIRAEDLIPARAGVRAQAVDTNGKLVDDFRFAEAGQWFHVLNAPSPAATACFAIGEMIAERLAAA